MVWYITPSFINDAMFWFQNVDPPAVHDRKRSRLAPNTSKLINPLVIGRNRVKPIQINCVLLSLRFVIPE